MSNLDELFKEKLADHSLPPSPAVWDKVEVNLSKKNNAIVWWRWAAVFVIGSLLLSSPWLLKDQEQQTISKKQEPATRRNEPVVEKVITPSPKAVIASQKGRIKTAAPQKSKSSNDNAIEPAPVEETVASSEIKEEKLNPEATVAAAPASSRSIVLTYTLEDVTAAVETPTERKEEVVAAVDAPKKEKSFKKVMTFAKEMKNGDRPISLRDMKDELFAGDLKKKTTEKKH